MRPAAKETDQERAPRRRRGASGGRGKSGSKPSLTTTRERLRYADRGRASWALLRYTSSSTSASRPALVGLATLTSIDTLKAWPSPIIRPGHALDRRRRRRPETRLHRRGRSEGGERGRRTGSSCRAGDSRRRSSLLLPCTDRT